jgi:small subunit ribosomal protein S10e
MVLVSKAEKRAIFQYLLMEGVIVVRKDSYLPKHQSIESVPNLKVMMIVKSLVSQGYLNQVFNWQWNYYTVTNKGVVFLAKALGKSLTPLIPHLSQVVCPINLSVRSVY